MDGGRGIRPDLRVGVARGQPEQDHVAGLHLPAAEHGVTGGPAPDDRVDRRLVPQDLLQGVGQRHMASGEAGPEARVGQYGPQRVGDQVGGGLVGRDQHDPQVHQHFGVAQVRGVLDQPGREVAHGPRLALHDQVFQRGGDVAVALEGRLGPLEHVARRVDQQGSVFVGCPDELGHDQHRELVGEGGHQVGVPLTRDLVDELVGEAGHVAADAALVEALQGLHHGRAQPLVNGPVGEVAHRHPGDHGAERGVGRHPALFHVAPSPRVAGEARGRACHVQVLPVAEDQPGRKVSAHQYRGHRPVFGPQLLVQREGIGLGLRPVEAVQAAGGRRRRVGGALGRWGGAVTHIASWVAAWECR